MADDFQNQDQGQNANAHRGAEGRSERGGHRGGGGPEGGQERGRRGSRDREEQNRRREPGEVEDVVVRIYRCATVVRGGRRFSFAALVVAGDRLGKVGVGYGKANEVPTAVEKATKAARRNMVQIRMNGTTIPHQVSAKYRASRVVLVPAGEGTGVIAGASVRAVMELAGVKDVLTKAYGSTSPKNLVKAAFEGLRQLRTKEEVEKLRGVTIAV